MSKRGMFEGRGYGWRGRRHLGRRAWEGWNAGGEPQEPGAESGPPDVEPEHHEHHHHHVGPRRWGGRGFGRRGHGAPDFFPGQPPEDHPGHHFGGGGRPGWGWGGPGGPGGPGGRGRGGRGGPGGPGGPGWGGRPRAGRGDVRAAALSLLAERPLHGYEIIQQIMERSGGLWRPSPGSVYPALQLLEDQGLIQGEQSEGRRVFHLTEAGRNYVKEHEAELKAAWEAVKGAVDDSALELHDLFQQVGAALRQVIHAGTAAQVGAAQKLLASTRRQLYRILAEDEEAEGQDPAL